MQFCESCDNTLYMNVNDGSTFLYCKSCSIENDQGEPHPYKEEQGEQETPQQDMRIYNSIYSKNHMLYFNTLVNEYSLYDNTLPILPKDIDTKHKCKDSTIRYVCYDESKLLYI